MQNTSALQPMKSIFLPGLALLLSLTSTTLAQENQEQSIAQFVSEIDEKMPQLLQDFSVPGAAIAIIENGEIVLQKGYGFSDIENEVKVDTKTGFNIGSISKTFAAWGVMKLVQDGKLDLDAPAEKYLSRWHLPESEFDSNEVTIRRLLSHTAGLSLHGYPGWSPTDELPTIEESLNGKNNGPGRVEIIMEPGTRYKYSGGGYTILQLIIEEVTGQKFEDYMQSQVLDPLGMTNSSYKIDDKIMTASSSEYDSFGEAIDFELFTAQAAAGFHTTIEDFTRFAYANLYRIKDHEKHNPVIPGNIIEQMMKPVPQAEGRYGYGLAYFVESIPGTSVVLRGHRGANTGWQAIFHVNPETNDGFIMVTNGGGGQRVYYHIFSAWVRWQTGVRLEDWHRAKPPIANKLKSIVDSTGIDDIAAIYTELKKNQSEEYDFSESQLNNLGCYYMYDKVDLEKAIPIFKINVEAFPNAFNVFDSLGEALLKQGAREEAIENYMTSVKLNPGNKNGVKVLNDLGVSTDDLIKEISVAVDAQVLAGYVGRYKVSSGGSTMTIQTHEGVLTAELYGQQMNLIAESAARFRVLEDESTVTFFTAATGRKGLWTRQSIWGKLPETTGDSGSEEPEDHSALEAGSAGDFLIFRNTPSWGRSTDFADVVGELGCKYEKRESSAMADVDLSPYGVIIIPGGQLKDFYNDYISNAARFDDYVASGGTLVLELNWAQVTSIMLPRGVTMATHGALENAILVPDHPIFLPLLGKRLIQAHWASSGYLQDVPSDALILAVESNGEETLADRPTFIEYSHGKGRVIAACQCFHDGDDSGRGPLMESVISYVLSKSWAEEN